MTRFDRTLPPSRRLFRPRFSVARLAAVIVGGLANAGALALGGLALMALAVQSGGDLPTTRKGWRSLLLLVMVALAGVAAYHAFT
ncbi:hypothetical protein ACI2UK_13545 [Ralstonia nicotianae]|uniref:hypothetical protein n=1 Tax=Ralstonia pseudosolanacearum TaxID=1310165 RepID=UPI0020046FAD|nr:hypothetical protein [Ralstonia pseudosolanacearum]MCK4118431.1 hypothetical protein [Ralstonia pseudosolanacearum]